MELVIDSLITGDESMKERKEKFVIEGFSQQEGANLDDTLTPLVTGFSLEEGVDLNGLMHAPPVFYFNINEFVRMLGLPFF